MPSSNQNEMYKFIYFSIQIIKKFKSFPFSLLFIWQLGDSRFNCGLDVNKTCLFDIDKMANAYLPFFFWNLDFT
jgi:hypothetical protein